MSDNGRIPIIGQHRTVADLNAQQRSALMDETLTALHELMLQVAGLANEVSKSQRAMLALHKEHEALEQTVREQRAMLDAHAGIVLRPTLLGRLRWLVTGL